MYLLIFSIFFTAKAWSWPPYYGPEFTFTSEELIDADIEIIDDKRLEFSEQWKRICQKRKNCKVNIGVRNTKVEFDDGWWFQLEADNGVIEVTAKPSALVETRKNKLRIQRDIFDRIEKWGLTPDAEVGGGHISIGANVFDTEPNLLRNFVVDQANHPELATGILSHDWFNSRPVAAWPQDQIDRFLHTINQYDSQQTGMTPLELAVELNRPRMQNNNAFKHDAINLAHYVSAKSEELRRVENRAVRPQQSAEEYILELEIMESRLEYLRKNFSTNPLQPNIIQIQERFDANRAVAFYDYISETGQDWDRVVQLVPSHYRSKLKSKVECRLLFDAIRNSK